MRFIFYILVLLIILGWDIPDQAVRHDSTRDSAVTKIAADTNGINQLFDLYYKSRNSNPSLALDYLQRAQIIANTIDNKEKAALVLYHKGYLYRMLGIYNFAIKSYISSLNYYETVGNKNLEAWILIDIGNLYFIQKEKSLQAIEHYQKAANLFAELGITQGIIVASNNIGLVYQNKKELDKALLYFHKANALSDKINDAEDKMLALSYIGQTHLSKYNLDSAKIYFDQLFKLSSAKKIKEWIAFSYDNYASIYNMRQDPENAIKNYQMALSIYQETGGKLNIALMLQKIGNAYAESKNYAKAVEYALQALAIAEQNKLVSASFEILPVIAGYYSAMNDYKSAFNYLDRYNHLKESDMIQNMQQIQAEYEKDLRHKEEELYKKEQALKDSEIRQQQFLIYFSLGGLIIFVGLFLIILARSRQLKFSNQHLFKYSLEIIQKEQELQEIKKKEKYATSLLTEEGNYNLYNNLLQLMEQEKIFLNNKLTIEDVAKKLNTNRTYLSQIINEKTHSNFNNFINKYRVQEAQIRLLNDENKSYTIEGIAQSVGFSSKSTFNGAFKKITGLTPSEFIEMKK
jgi:AraC-like DNA-binding protein